jgi:hypothetical protein
MFGVRIVPIPQYCLLVNEIKAELNSELKSAIRSTVAEAIEEVVNPLRQLINEHQNKIKCLENENGPLDLTD